MKGLQLAASIFVFLFSQINSSAQTFYLSGGLERSHFLTPNYPYFALQFEQKMGNRLNLEAGLGFVNHTSHDVLNYDIPEKLKTVAPFLGLSASLFGNSKRDNLKVGLGLRYLRARLDHVQTANAVEFNKNVVSYTLADYDLNRWLADISIKNDFNINRRFSIGLEYRFCPFLETGDIKTIKRTVFRPNGYVSSEASQLPLLHFLLRLGYRF